MVSQLGKRKRLKRVLCWYIYFISVWRRLLLAGVWKLLVHWKRPTFFGRSVEAAGAVEGVHCQADLPQYHPLPPRLHLPQVQPFTRNIVSTDKLFKGSVSQDYRWLFTVYHTCKGFDSDSAESMTFDFLVSFTQRSLNSNQEKIIF